MTSSIYTRTGDSGTTSLCDGTRVPKEALRIQAYGEVDEANSWVGTARSFADDELLDRVLEFLQHRLYNCSSNLATPPGASFTPVGIADDDVAFLERAVDRFERDTGPLEGFVLPGGTRAAGFMHLARTVCRRAERTIWALSRDNHVDESVVRFLNRASDLLFAAARYANVIEKTSDVLWEKELRVPALE